MDLAERCANQQIYLIMHDGGEGWHQPASIFRHAHDTENDKRSERNTALEIFGAASKTDMGTW